MFFRLKNIALLCVLSCMFFTSFSRNSRARNSEYVRYAENYFEIIEKFENNNPCFIDCKNDYDNLKQKGQRLFEKSKKLKKDISSDDEKQVLLEEEIATNNSQLFELIDEISVFSNKIQKCLD